MMRITRRCMALSLVALLGVGTAVVEKTVPATAVFLPAAIAEATTSIHLSDDRIDITGHGARAQGNTLTITEDGVYELTGTLSNGQIVIDASKKATVELILSGVDITASENAAIYCKKADLLIITLTDGTQNTVKDASRFSFADKEKEEPNATIFSKCDLRIGGTGRLTVHASYRHGINTKDDLVIDGGEFVLDTAVDALRGSDSINVKAGNFQIVAGGDGFKSSKSDDDSKGWVLLEDGSYQMNVSGDAVQAETDLTISGGSFTVTTEGKPAGGSDSQKGFKAGNLLTVNGGVFDLHTADDAFHADVDAVINDGVLTIETKDDGIHADRYLTINGGNIQIPVCYEGLEGTIITYNGGNTFIKASNDALSGAAGTPEAEAFSGRGANPNVEVRINGGELEAVARGDVVDSNGNITVTGGTLRLSAPPWPDYEGSLLCNGDVTITGGTIASVGCMGVNVYWGEQPILWVSHSKELPSGTVLSLRDSTGNTITELTTLSDAVQSVFTSPALTAGETYTLFIDDAKQLDVTLGSGMNAIGDDGGSFTGGYSRGNMAEYR